MADEIILCILETLDRNEDRGTILNLRKVDRRWLRIASPYVDVTLNQGEMAGLIRNKGGWVVVSRPDSFVCGQIAQLPNCAVFIKSLETRQKARPLRVREEEEDNKEIRDRYSQTLSKTEPDNRMKNGLISEVMKGYNDAQVAFIFLMCRNLESFSCVQYGHFGRRTKQVLQIAAKQSQTPGRNEPLPILGRLKHFKQENSDASVSITESYAIYVLSILSIQHAEFKGLRNNQDTGTQRLPVCDMKAVRPSIIDLTLDECWLGLRGLTRVLAACGKVRRLYLNLCKPVRDGEPVCTYSLAKYCKDLEFFYFRHDDPFDKYRTAEFLRYISTLDKLESFVLHIPQFAEAADLVAALPRSLRELMFFGTYSEEDQNLFQSLVHDEKRPFLQRVVYMEARMCSNGKGRVYLHGRTDVLYTNYCRRERRIPPSHILHHTGYTVHEYLR